RRGVSVLDLLRTRHADGGRLLVGSHGNLIALMLQALEPAVGAEFHRAMPMPRSTTCSTMASAGA
ncbi:MAG: hypothetical protein M3O78_03865, partial [Chloroflexota bacterium]|nr:hypothetical protein [Chloroflexota bacterium]